VVFEDCSLIDWDAFAAARANLGANFIRILGYFEEDGAKSVGAIEAAMRARNSVAMIIPAHTLKGEARQFGAQPLAAAAETIETIARDCVETKDAPDAALPQVVGLRRLFEETLALLQREANPLVERAVPAARRFR